MYDCRKCNRRQYVDRHNLVCFHCGSRNLTLTTSNTGALSKAERKQGVNLNDRKLF